LEFIYKVEDESVATKKLEESASEVSNSGAYPQQPIGVYTMKKFKIKEPSIMRLRKGKTHQNLINSSERQGVKKI
jgi:hypothetical protein